jgi:predicted Fe-Mo cluster-binding NifX family protein
MKIFISALENSMEAQVDQRFGRCAWLIGVDSDTGDWQALENPGAALSGGAGVAAAQFVLDHGAGVVISGDFGPHAAQAFGQAGVEMRLFTAEVSRVKDAVSLMLEKKLPLFKD